VSPESPRAAPSVESPARRLLCPQCRGTLATTAGAHRCESCGERYAWSEGIPLLLRPGRGDLARLEQEYWDERFAAEGNPAALRATYAKRDYFRDDWGLLAYVERVAEAAPRGATVLEIGTGIESRAAPLALHHGFTAVLTDVAVRSLSVNREALETMRENAAIEYYAADASSLPFESASFDVILLHAALHHLEKPRESIAEMARCLVPGGLLVVGYEPNRLVFEPLRKIAAALRLTERHSRRFVHGRYSVADDETPGFFAKDLRAWVGENRLDIVWLEPVWLVAAFVYQVPSLTHVVLGRHVELPAGLRRLSRAADRLLFALPPLRRLCFAWSLAARKPLNAG
jgi:SAM-dependent methyltransferase